MAVFRAQARQYTVTWQLADDDKVYTIEESYTYNQTPQQPSVKIAPEGMVFANWDHPLDLVTEDTTYVAEYEYDNRVEISGVVLLKGDSRVGGVLSVDVSGVAGKDCLSYQWCLDGEVIPNAVNDSYIVKQSDILAIVK